MAKNEAKVTFLAETESFRANISQAASEITKLNSQLKLNDAQMKTNGVSIDGLTDKHKLLEDKLELARTKTQNLEAQLESCARNFGENSVEVQKLETQINNALTAEEKIRQEIQKVNTALTRQAAEAGKTENALEQLENTISAQESALSSLKSEYAAAALEYGTNSKEARELASRISQLSGELNENRGKMSAVETAANNMEQELDDAGDAARDADGGFTVLRGTLANLASTAITSAVSSIGNLATSFWNLGDETREFRTEMGKLEAAFTAANHSTETAAATYETLYGVIGETDQSVEAAQQIALLATSTQEAAQWADLAAGVVGRFGDALQPETFFEAANETMKLGEATGAYVQMLEGTGMSVEEFNAGLAACTTESERQAYMLSVTQQALGAAGAAYQANNASIIAANEAQNNYNAGLAGLGAVIEPIKTVFMNGMAGMLESATQFISGIDMESVKASIEGAFNYINDTVFPAIKTGIQWFLDNKDLIIAGIAGIVAGIAAFKIVSIVQTAVGAFQAFQAATVGLTVAQKALNLVMSMNPIGLVVALIAGLVTAFITLWNNCEGFRNFWIGLWDGIKSVAGAVCSWLGNAFSAAWNAIKNAWSSTKAFFSDIWNGIKNVFATVKTWFTNLFKGAWNGIKNAWNSVKSWFSNIWNGIKNVFSSVGTWFRSIFVNAWNNIKNAWSSVKSWFSNIWTGIKNVFGSVGSWFRDKFNAAWTSIKNVFSNWGSFFSGLWDKIKNTFSGLGTKLGDAIGGAVKSGINKVFGWVESILNKGIGLINGAIGLINKIPGVNIGKIGNISLPRLASGGVLRTETPFIGGEYPGARRNPEIVTPQSIMRETFEDALNAHLEQSLSLDRLVDAIDRLASRAINLDIDGNRFATATAGATDSVSGNRMNLKQRGLAL